MLAGYGLTGDDDIHAIRGLRALMHGFVSLEAAGGFAMPLDLDESYRRLVAGFGDTARSDPAGRPSHGANYWDTKSPEPTFCRAGPVARARLSARDARAALPLMVAAE